MSRDERITKLIPITASVVKIRGISKLSKNRTEEVYRFEGSIKRDYASTEKAPPTDKLLAKVSFLIHSSNPAGICGTVTLTG